jgi:polyamine oxidase
MISSRFLPLLVSCSCVVVTLAASLPLSRRQQEKHATVLILGGGVAGVIAAKTLTEQGIKDFKIIEARGELGGRLHSETFGEPGRQATVEVGAGDPGCVIPPVSADGSFSP